MIKFQNVLSSSCPCGIYSEVLCFSVITGDIMIGKDIA